MGNIMSDQIRPLRVSSNIEKRVEKVTDDMLTSRMSLVEYVLVRSFLQSIEQ